MIVIKINGSEIDLFPNMKIKMKNENPFFSDNFINDGYSYSFSFPLTPKNKKIFSKSVTKINVLFKGTNVITGKIINTIDTSSNILVNIISEGSDVRQQLEDTFLNELNLDSYTILFPGLTSSQKISQWQNHMNTYLSNNYDEFTHFFPQLFAHYRDEASAATDQKNVIYSSLGSLVNKVAGNQYQLNFGVPSGTYSGKSWSTTVMPAPRSSYLLKKVFEKLNIKIVVNELEDILEFKQHFIISNYVLDQLETESGNSWNVIGEGYDLKNHVPNTNCFNFLKTLNEQFGATFIFSNNEVQIRTFKKQLKVNPVNISKYTNEEVTNESITEDEIGFSFNYDLSDEDRRIFKNALYFDTDYLKIVPDYQPYENINYPEANKANSEIDLIHIPLASKIFFSDYGYPRDHDEYLKIDDPVLTFEVFHKNQLECYLAMGYEEFLVSDESDEENEITEKIRCGLFRGMGVGFQPDLTGAENHSNFSYPFFCNFKEFHIRWGYPGEANVDMDFDFGNSSLYYGGFDNLFDVHIIRYWKARHKANLKSKLLYLPLFELLELMKWKKTSHVIQQKNESFKGTVKNISFTLTNEGLSPTEIEYIKEYVS